MEELPRRVGVGVVRHDADRPDARPSRPVRTTRTSRAIAVSSCCSSSRATKWTTCQVDLWGSDRYEIPNQRKIKTAGARALPRTRARSGGSSGRAAGRRRGRVLPGLVRHDRHRRAGAHAAHAGVVRPVHLALRHRRRRPEARVRRSVHRARISKLVDRVELAARDARCSPTRPSHADYYVELRGHRARRVGVVWLGAQDDSLHAPDAQHPCREPRRSSTARSSRCKASPTIIAGREAARDPTGFEVRIIGSGPGTGHRRPR